MSGTVDGFMEGTRAFGGSRVTHWLIEDEHGAALTACGIRLAGRPLIRHSRALNEADCKRCLAANVPDLDEVIL